MKSLIHKLVVSLGLLVASFGFLAAPAQAQVGRPTPTRTTTTHSGDISLAQAQQIFREMAAQRDIAFRYVTDGCYARAFLMIQRMQERGYRPVRVWTFANGDNLHVKTRLAPGGFVEWGYHVAPALVVSHNGKRVYMVIDPSMFNRPVTLAEWVNAQKRTATSNPIVQVTKLGEAPVNPRTRNREGSGYWPGNDPAGGIMAHAIATMRSYKMREPRG